MNYSQNSQGVHADQALKNILIPNSNTAFRLTLFLWNPTYDGGAGSIVFTVQWTAPFGGVRTATVTINLASAPSSQTIDQTIWVLAGTPIQYSVLGGGVYGAATYSYLVGMKDLTTDGDGGGGGGCGNGGIAVIPPLPMQRQSCCNRCQQNPCCCQQYQPPPQVIVVPQQQPQLPFFPPRIPFRQPYPYNDWQEEGGPYQDCCQ